MAAMRFDPIRRYAKAGLGLALLACVATLDASAQRTAAPDIVPRAKWGARPADRTLMKPQVPREIVVHHTSLTQQPKLTLAQKLRALQGFSQSDGTVNGRPKAAWGDVPYHFYIDLTGRIGEGRDVNYAGDTNTRYNTANRIQIVLEGHFDKEEPTPAQLQSLDALVLWLAGRHGVPAAKISGHNDHAATDCPGRNLKSYLPQLQKKVADASVGGGPTRVVPRAR
jgi:N-acetylmuramoyl-L-alanine amidase